MRLGIVAKYTDDDIARLRRLGGRCCELLVFPDCPLSPQLGATQSDWERARDRLAGEGIAVSAVGCYSNNLAPDPAHRAQSTVYMESLIGLAQTIGAPVVSTFAGCDPSLPLRENIPRFHEVFAPLVARAVDAGVRLAIENCPMFRGPRFECGNIAYTPEAWDLMFDAVDSPALGLEFDPSHLVCLQIDPVGALRPMAGRVFHVHAKDGEIIPGNLARYGILDFRSVRHRMPGLGSCDWPGILGVLAEAGYSGDINIEGAHDPIFCGDREEEGLAIGLGHLRASAASLHHAPK